jgi:hypothetical protein
MGTRFIGMLAVLAGLAWLTACSGGSAMNPRVLPPLDLGDSVAGVDADANGVRDDLDEIISAQNDTPLQKAALVQTARALRADLGVDPANASAVSHAAGRLNQAVACVFTRFDAAEAAEQVQWLEQLSANTMLRLEAYLQFNRAKERTAAEPAEGGICGG